MEIVVIKKSDKERIFQLAVEEDRILQKFCSQPVYRVSFLRVCLKYFIIKFIN